MKRDLRDGCGGGRGGGGGAATASGRARGDDEGSSSMGASGKGRMWDDGMQQQDAGVDELLADLGYNVRSSDMVDVAQKLEQLEMVMVSAQGDGISHLSSGTVHYNPSDLCGWVQSMLTELNPSSSQQTLTDDPLLAPAESSTITTLGFSSSQQQQQQHHHHHHHQSHIYNDDSEYDLSAIPGVSLYRRPDQPGVGDGDGDGDNSSNKRMKTTSSSSSSSSQQVVLQVGNGLASVAESTRPVVVVDSQEAGVRLVHALMACAEAVQQENMKLADALLKHIGVLAASQAGAMRKVATYFAESLARRIYRIYPQDPLESSYADILQMHFYEAYPYLKFAHFTANQAILEAFAGATRVHVIDFGLKQGMQWPALMQALALRPGGPPAFRLTGIGPPPPDNTDALQQVGWRLAQLAETIGVEFEFRGFVANSLADLEPSMLQILPPEVEAVAVNSVLELHRLLARPGAMEKVLSSIKAMKPKIVTVVEQEANHNGPVFLERFTEALHYYSNLFDSLEGCGCGVPPPSCQDLMMSEIYLGRQICNVVACEGAERVERHERLSEWRNRFGSAGFEPVHLGSNAFRQASMLLALFAGGEGYRVEENNGCLMLGWHTRPLIATSAWQLNSTTTSAHSHL